MRRADIRHLAGSCLGQHVARVAGFGWGVTLGIFLGLLIGLSRVTERVLDPTIQMMRNIPVTAWVPLSLVFFGIGNAPAVS